MTIPVVRFVFGGEEAHAAGSGRPWTVVYDGQCKVCGRLVKLLDQLLDLRAVLVHPNDRFDRLCHAGLHGGIGLRLRDRRILLRQRKSGQ